METPIEDDPGVESPPKKKVKMDDSTAVSTSSLSHVADMKTPQDVKESITEAGKDLAAKELVVGIGAFVSDDAGFQGILKRRYHDFLVNEIMPDGKVVRLDDPEQLKPPLVPNDTSGQEEKGNMSKSANGATAENDTDIVHDAGGTKVNSTHTHGDKGDDRMEIQASETTDGNTQVSQEMQIIYDLSTGENKDPTRPRIELTDQNFMQLQKYFGMDEIKKLASLFHEVSEASQKDIEAYGFVYSIPIDDKDDRKIAHQMIRTIFLGRIESTHHDGNVIRCKAVLNATSRKVKSRSKQKNTAASRPLRWDQLGGDYMHFTLYKENRDSGDILGFISSKLNMKGQKAFDTAGTKDRRAVTVQRVSAFRVRADRFMALNNIIKHSRVGDCCYSQKKLQLGDLAGNEFLITLRDCTVRVPNSGSVTRNPEDIERYIRQGMHNLCEKGFINYYGLQRFGSYAVRTDTVGQYMLQEEYKTAVDTILQYSPEALEAAQSGDNEETIPSDDQKRAQAIYWFLTKTAPTDQILDTLPRRFIAEYAIVSFLSRAKDQANPYYRGALEAIPRNIRSLYSHAYQSLIWNLAATHRWNLSPGKLLPGDLVLIPNQPPQNDPSTEFDPIYAPTAPQHGIEQAHALTEQDIATNRYTIFDIVLPQPGHDILYPTFMLPFYQSTMQQHGSLDPLDMRRSWREVNLPGSYRKLLGRPAEKWSFTQVQYHEPDAKIALTDLDKLEIKQRQQQQKEQGQEGTLWRETAEGIALAEDIPVGDRLAILLRFQLPASTYATMALRELMKSGPVEYKPEFSGGRGV